MTGAQPCVLPTLCVTLGKSGSRLGLSFPFCKMKVAYV